MVEPMGKIISLALAFASLFSGLAFYWNAGTIAAFDWLIVMAVLAGTHFVFILFLIVACTMKFSRRGKRPFPMRTPLLIMLIGLIAGDTLLVLSANLNHARERETEVRGDMIVEKARLFYAREKRFPKNLSELGTDLPVPAIEGSHFEVSGERDEDFIVSFHSIGSTTCSKSLAADSNWRCDD